MASGRRKELDHGVEHGEIQDLGSPILSKIQQAFLYIRTLASGTAHDEFSSYRSIEGSSVLPEETVLFAVSSAAPRLLTCVVGCRCGAMHVAWDKDEARLVLFSKVSLTAVLLPKSRQQRHLLSQLTPHLLETS